MLGALVGSVVSAVGGVLGGRLVGAVGVKKVEAARDVVLPVAAGGSAFAIGTAGDLPDWATALGMVLATVIWKLLKRWGVAEWITG